jgi:hypothetical protein
MKKFILVFCLFVLVTLPFGTAAQDIQKQNQGLRAWIFMANFGISYPKMDLASRFGMGTEVGGGVWYKSPGNWIFGLESHYYFGSIVKETNMLDQFINDDGFITGNNGFRAQYRIQMRGSKLPILRFGKVIPIKILRADFGSGLMLSLGVGTLTHRIRIIDDSRAIDQLSGDYLKGYDRFTLGPMLTQMIGYIYQDERRKINFFLSVEAAQAITRSQREINFDTGLKDSKQRFDGMFTFKFGWFFPVYANRDSDFYYF